MKVRPVASSTTLALDAMASQSVKETHHFALLIMRALCHASSLLLPPQQLNQPRLPVTFATVSTVETLMFAMRVQLVTATNAGLLMSCLMVI